MDSTGKMLKKFQKKHSINTKKLSLSKNQKKTRSISFVQKRKSKDALSIESNATLLAQSAKNVKLDFYETL